MDASHGHSGLLAIELQQGADEEGERVQQTGNVRCRTDGGGRKCVHLIQAQYFSKQVCVWKEMRCK